MKVLLDEDVPQPLARLLPRHQVETVLGRGWSSTKNGELLKLIEAERFEWFVTGDKNMQRQQRLWPAMTRHVPAIADALDAAQNRTVTLVECGTFVSRKLGKPPGQSF